MSPLGKIIASHFALSSEHSWNEAQRTRDEICEANAFLCQPSPSKRHPQQRLPAPPGHKHTYLVDPLLAAQVASNSIQRFTHWPASQSRPPTRRTQLSLYTPSNAFVASPFAATIAPLIQIYRNSDWVDLVWPSVEDMYRIAIDGRKKAVMTWARIHVAAIGLGTTFSDLVARNIVWQFNEGGVYSLYVHPTGQFGQDGSTTTF
ncbi:hypothetical protein V5O48_012892 [Marasmius crinis-equi]|uniref:Uncharacterized protein n=1 Tax=Marasmius crinis-equi TaxID=585013 RepID=A0ABR3F1K6_9AGAR